jgi:hypothetical protein
MDIRWQGKRRLGVYELVAAGHMRINRREVFYRELPAEAWAELEPHVPALPFREYLIAAECDVQGRWTYWVGTSQDRSGIRCSSPTAVARALRDCHPLRVHDAAANDPAEAPPLPPRRGISGAERAANVREWFAEQSTDSPGTIR